MATREQPGAGSAEAPRLPERYRVKRHLASGGTASVWCAEDQVLGRTVAVKVLSERFATDPMAMRRFKREARAAARVSNHPHVVTIFDVGDLDPDEGQAGEATRPFIVMEYLAGGTVADAIRLGSVRRQEAVRWIREAASALDHAHERGIVHRDIKPGNFLLNRSRVLYVADFGIARLVSEDTISSAGELFGTAAYLSPEQALGLEATGASDRYALAVAAFELLAGERPFLTQHFAAQARQHIEDEPPRASTVDRTLPPAVDPVLSRGMAKQPEDRFPTAGAFIDALETALSGGLLIDPAATTVRRRRPAAARTGAMARAGAAAAAVSSAAHGREASVPSGPVAWTPADSLQSGSFGRRGGGRLIALAALVIAVVGIGALAIAGLGGSPHRAGSAADRTTPHSATAPAQSSTTTATHVRHHKRAPTTTTATPTTQAAAPTTPSTPEALQVAGHEQMLAGNYQTAISTLRKAVAAATPGSLTYAYGLYDLGRSLVLAGDPGGAVPVLEARLKIPNQTGVVKQELNQALQASGQVPGSMTTPSQPGTSTKHGKGQGPSHGKANGHNHSSPSTGSGGAGLPSPGGANTQSTQSTQSATSTEQPGFVSLNS
jgi:eukaryotic-like serine/threonine-protein kinase